MARPDIEPGVYESKGKLFAYKGDEKEEEVSKHPYFNAHVYLPDGKDVWWCEQGRKITNAKKLEQEEIDTRIANLSKQRQTPRISQLIEFLKENSGEKEED